MSFDFSKNNKLDDLTNVPQGFQYIYEQADDGGYVIGEQHKEIINLAINLQKALGNERRKKEPTIDLSPLSEFGDSPEAILESIQTLQSELKQLASKANIDPAKIKQEAVAETTKQYQGRLEESEKLVAQLTSKLENVMVDEQVATVAAKYGAPVEMWQPVLKNLVRTEYEDGDYRVFVVDQGGDRRYGMSGDPMTIQELVESMERDESKAWFFPSKAKAGSGMPPENRNGSAPKNRPNMSPADKINAGLSAKA